MDGWKTPTPRATMIRARSGTASSCNALPERLDLLTQNAALFSQAPGAAALELAARPRPAGARPTANHSLGNGLGHRRRPARHTDAGRRNRRADARLSHRLTWVDDARHHLRLLFRAYRQGFDRLFLDRAARRPQQRPTCSTSYAVDAAGNVVKTFTDHGVADTAMNGRRHREQTKPIRLYLSKQMAGVPKLRIGRRHALGDDPDAPARIALKKNGQSGTAATSSILTGERHPYAGFAIRSATATWTIGADYGFRRRAAPFVALHLGQPPAEPGQLHHQRDRKADRPDDGPGRNRREICQPAGRALSTGFWTKYNNVSFTNYRFDLNTGASVTEALYADTQTFGLELEGRCARCAGSICRAPRRSRARNIRG